MSLLDYLFPVRLKDLESIRISYEKAVGDHSSQVSVSLLWYDDRQPKIQRSSAHAKAKEGENNRKG